MKINAADRQKLIVFLRSMQEKDFYDGAEDVAGSLLRVLEYQKRGRKVGWRKPVG